MSQKELAKLSGLHTMTISKIERGIQANIGIETLARIARGLSSLDSDPVRVSSLVSRAEREVES